PDIFGSGQDDANRQHLLEPPMKANKNRFLCTPSSSALTMAASPDPPSVQLGNWIGDGVRSGEEKAPRVAGKVERFVGAFDGKHLCVIWGLVRDGGGKSRRLCTCFVQLMITKPNNTSSQVGRGTRPALSPGRHRISELTKPSDSFIPPENIFLFLYSVAEDRGTQARCAPSC
ncbi:hypothetical protein KUCAC02_014627, partial [Chaenocephalus aceratus]